MACVLDRINGPDDVKGLSLQDLEALAQEIRDDIITVTAKNGGHVGASLGPVEIIVALHRVFRSPQDKIVFDIGHQAYAHKYLTGRRDRFHTLRQPGGISGFLSRSESPHDAFGAGHASTSISAALGFREALHHKGAGDKVVALIGDGALTGGIAFEGLNMAGELGKDFIVVLNDNDMSIAPNVGGVSRWLTRKLAGDTFNRTRRSLKALFEGKPMGDTVIAGLRHAVESTKALLTPGLLFEGLGFQYLGPIDGHDLTQLMDAFERAKKLDGPVLVHAVTTKGKGFKCAEDDPATYHGLGPFDPDTGALKKSTGTPAYTNFFAKTLVELAEHDPRILAITAAMPSGTGLELFRQKLPSRFYDVGIAEQHAVCFAAGLAAEGFRPVAAIYSTFLQRAYDQLIHDVGVQNLPITLALDRAGLVGDDGPTHQGVFDIAYLRSLPNFVVMAPADENELRHMLKTAIEHEGPAALRYPRGAALGVPLDSAIEALPIGKAKVMLGDAGADVAILAYGTRVHPALEAAALLSKVGIKAAVVNARFVKPLDEALLLELIRGTGRVVTVEEGVRMGGFGSAVLELMAAQDALVPTRILGIPDSYVEQGKVADQLAQFGLDAEGIARAATELVEGASSKKAKRPRSGASHADGQAPS